MGIEESIRRMVERCDCCVVDLDQCIYPGFTQTTLGKILVTRCLFRNQALLPRLLGGAFYISFTRAAQLMGRNPSNFELMSAFCRVIRNFPRKMLEEQSRRLPKRGPQEWREALGEVAARMSVYLVTFAIEPIARSYGEARDYRGRKIFRGYRSTPLEFDREGRITGCSFSKDSLSPLRKLEILRELLQGDSFDRPLVIGHGRDEAPMAVYASELNGGSIALADRGKASRDFQIILPAGDWRRLAAALREKG